MEAVYIHIPFCEHICSYCDFPKVLHIDTFVEDYLDALKKEIEDNYEGERIKTLYVGGGTPSSLNRKERIKLFRILQIFKRTANCEFTFEVNPNDITEEMLDDIILGGVNRISIGIQSFNIKNMKLLQRQNDYKTIESKIKMIKARGIDNINVDLMYALPGEKLSVLKQDLNLFLKLDVSHISTYSLILEKNTKLYIDGYKEIDEELDAKMYKTICNTLKKKGYNHYEVSNFCKEGFESRHNLNYWNNYEYYGFGLGASGYKEGVRYTNTRNLSDYNSGKYRLEENLLTRKEQMDNEVMLGFRKLKGIDINDFYEKYGRNIQQVYPVINDLLKKRELIYKNGFLYIPEDKIYVMNEILIKII